MGKRPSMQFWNPLSRVSIRQKLAIVTAILTFIVIGIFALVAYNAVTSEVHRNLNRHIQSVSQDMRSLLSFTSQNTDQISISIIANNDIQMAMRAANNGFPDKYMQDDYLKLVENEFFKTILGRDEIQAVFLLLDDGFSYSLVVNPRVNNKVISQEDLLRIKSAKGSLVWLPRDDLSRTIPLGRAYIDTISQKVTGALLIFIDEQYFTKYLSLKKHYFETYLLLSDEGNIISRSDKTIPETYLQTSFASRKFKTPDDSFFHDDIDGKKYHIWSLSIPEYHCRLVSFIPVSQIVKQTKALKVNLFIIGLVCWLLAASTGFFISRSILKPIDLLHQSIKKLDTNKSFESINWTSSDEIGLVVKAYNKMLVSLETVKSNLTKSEKEYRSIFQNAREGIFRCDSAGYILKANPAMARILGYPSSRALIDEKKTIQELINVKTDEQTSLAERFDWLCSHPEYELPGLTKLDKEIYVKLKIEKVVDDKRGVVWNDGILEDITRQKLDEEEKEKMQAHFLQVQKLESLGTLAGGIAHDFNNILSPIIAYAELAQDRDVNDPEVKEYIDEILVASDRARTLVQQILIFSRKDKSEKRPIEIGVVIKEALKLIKSAIPSTIELRQKIDSDAGTVFANGTQIHQVVMNLCTNAYQAMAVKGGLLEVTLKQVTIDVYQAYNYFQLNPGRYLTLIVTDTGHGIDPKNLTRVFEPYFTTKKVEEGTGMGLSTVLGIVRDHGGDIKIYSEPGVGTTFHVLFPISQEAVDHHIGETEHLPRGNEQILFIDDEKQVIESGKSMLEGLGYQVDALSNPLDALEMFRKDPGKYDLVFSDITMPKMTGDKLAKEILKIRPDIAVILSSGFSSKITRETLSQIGVRDLLQKPVTYKELATGVRRALDKATD